MMTYPKNYAPLAEEEMEYISGGLTITMPVALGVCTATLALLNLGNIALTAGELKQASPSKYPEPNGTINGNLVVDAMANYFTSVGGVLLGLLNIAAGVGTVYTAVNKKS